MGPPFLLSPVGPLMVSLLPFSGRFLVEGRSRPPCYASKSKWEEAVRLLCPSLSLVRSLRACALFIAWGFIPAVEFKSLSEDAGKGDDRESGLNK